MIAPNDMSADVRKQLAVLLGRALELKSAITGTAASEDTDGEHQRLVADRLTRSVIRPINQALDPGDASQRNVDDTEPTPDDTRRGQSAATPSPADGSATDAELLRLAEDATRLRVLSGAPAVQEAVAALQDLASRWESDVGEDAAAARLTALRKIMAPLPSRIESGRDGPYLVTNAENMVDWLGCALPSAPQMALCRCGQSKLKPVCDGTHAEIGFSDEKDPKRVADHQDRYVGQQVTILDNRGTCQHSGFCTDRLATAFRAGKEPFVRPSGGRMDEIIRAVRDCPSGALSYAIDGVEARDEVDYHGHREPMIEVTKDGPYRVTGRIGLLGPVGEPEPRNQGASLEHYALCRCGHSQNKPFCSGMHWYVEFKDPVPDPERPPTMFEWCGGLPALTRMTRLFYEKFVPEDPLLAPLFSDMSADHPQRVAKWLGEVFGGPARYSDEYGGYPRMISQHVGKGLTEEWRTRWVALLLQSARETGMPNDPEFAAAFQSYIEWGSRLAVENSQTTSHPPEHMPMPHWDWTTGAGAPGGRISALAPHEEEDEPPVVLPADDELVRFEKHIKPLFRPRDRQSMKFVFDLWAYEDVNANAAAILERLSNGTMPCDGAWPPEKVNTFQRWTTSGKSK
jgi:CDGSH-type Zn-finger protein/truncated hemoglobin YjbI